MRKYKTSDIIEVEDYPYGSKKTVCKFSLEFNPKKGFRSVKQTKNPRTDKWNKEKKSTYSDIVLMCQDLEGKIKYCHFSFYDIEKVKKFLPFLSENFNCFNATQIKYLYINLYHFLIGTLRSMVIYSGSNQDDLKKIMTPALTLAKECVSNSSNNMFKDIAKLLDCEAINATKQTDFNPFVVKRLG